MSRRRYLIAYDITEPKRLRRIINIMESYGERLQYSVFLCDLSKMELLAWKAEVLEVIELQADSIVTIDLGAPGQSAISVLGTPRQLPSSGPVIV